MEDWRKNAMCSAFLVILIVAFGEVSCVEAEDCWNVDHHYIFCARTHKCRETCQSHGDVDGRCNGAFPYLWPVCECLPPNCES